MRPLALTVAALSLAAAVAAGVAASAVKPPSKAVSHPPKPAAKPLPVARVTNTQALMYAETVMVLMEVANTNPAAPPPATPPTPLAVIARQQWAPNREPIGIGNWTATPTCSPTAPYAAATTCQWTSASVLMPVVQIPFYGETGGTASLWRTGNVVSVQNFGVFCTVATSYAHHDVADQVITATCRS